MVDDVEKTLENQGFEQQDDSAIIKGEGLEQITEDRERCSTEKTKGFNVFSKIGGGIKKAGDAIGGAIKEGVDGIKENNADKKALKDAFEKASREYSIVYKKPERKKKTIRCIIDENNKILRTDDDSIIPCDIDCIQDSRKQPFYIKFVKDARHSFVVEREGRELKKELLQIEYTNEAPKEEKHIHIDNFTNTTTIAGKNAIIGENIQADKSVDLKLGINLPKL